MKIKLVLQFLLAVVIVFGICTGAPPCSYKEISKCIMDKGGVHIEYPCVKGFPNEDKINSIILEAFTENIYIHEFIDDNNSFLRIEFNVLSYTSRFLSIVAFGNFNNVTAAHPLNIFFTLNIDILSNEIVKCSELCNLELLQESFIKHAKEQLDSLVFEFLFENSVVLDYYSESFKMIDDNNTWGDSVFFGAFDGESCIISFKLPHVLGDHAEVFIPLVELGL